MSLEYKINMLFIICPLVLLFLEDKWLEFPKPFVCKYHVPPSSNIITDQRSAADQQPYCRASSYVSHPPRLIIIKVNLTERKNNLLLFIFVKMIKQ